MNWHNYRRMAETNKPQDEQTLRAAAVELRTRGLTHRDIGTALDVAPDAVAVLLREIPT